jgi:hypothetical protein
MKLRTLLIKCGVVLSSTLLVGGMVLYHSGAFDWLLERNKYRSVIMGGSKAKVFIDPATLRDNGASRSEPTFMYTSKFIAFPALDPDSSPSANEPAEVFQPAQSSRPP